MSKIVQTDALIIGGGIAGLWTYHRLRSAGYHAVLIEKNRLGSGQSIQSQGIIHGGTKYALQGSLTQAADAIADMPARWRSCLTGSGEIDLSAVRVLSNYHYMWSKGRLASKLTTFFASKAVRGRIEPVSKAETPEVFANPAFKGSLYALNEIVLDVPSIFEAIHSQWQDGLYQLDLADGCEFSREGDTISEIHLRKQDLTIRPRKIVLTAGEGNESLLQWFERAAPQMQRRPLHMVVVKHPHKLPIYAHCVGTGAKPLITITSHPCEDGSWAWYLGGNLAETGLERSPKEQVAEAKSLLKKLLPWVDLSDASWSAFMINRAEPKQSSLTRPDTAFTQQEGNLITTWPTKLALAPNLADEVLQHVEASFEPINEAADYSALSPLNRAEVAPPVWETLFQ